MKKIQVITDGMAGMVDAAAIAALDAEARKGLELLTSGEGAGADFLGWVKLPEETDDALLDDINATAARLRETCEVVVAVGIGGSYLGAKAVIEALSDSFAPYRAGTGTRVLFAGQNIGEDYMAELQDYLRDKKFGIIVISKSGTTTEPAIAFRLLK
ncbi:MAG: glucose-6-phosphate isomerase, partial [Muribaculaceae bacterium]